MYYYTMSNLMNTYFGPLSKNYCNYFLFLSMFFFTVMTIIFIFEIYYLVKNRKNLIMTNMTKPVLLVFNLFILYFVNRLLYTMCSKSLG